LQTFRKKIPSLSKIWIRILIFPEFGILKNFPVCVAASRLLFSQIFFIGNFRFTNPLKYHLSERSKVRKFDLFIDFLYWEVQIYKVLVNIIFPKEEKVENLNFS
jgi:hypothetical protein